MAKKIILKTMATDLGLSIGTVSRVINGKGEQFRISKETIEAVLNYAKQMNYSPNLNAKGLQASKTFTIGLMIPDISNPFFSLLAKHIEKAASKANFSILLVDAEESVEREKMQVKNLVSRNVDGIIAVPVGASFNHYVDILNEDIPLVFVDRYFENFDVPFISSDNFNGAYEATKMLIENGHKRIALIKGDDSIEPVKERRKGFVQALKEAGIEPDKGLILGTQFSVENGYYSTKKLLESKLNPTAIFAMSNLIGLGCLQAIKEKKINIPDDISLLIFDDQPYVAYLDPPITTVKQNLEKIGELAMEYVFKKMDDKNAILESQFIPTKIILRNSIRKIN